MENKFRTSKQITRGNQCFPSFIKANW